MTIHALRGGDGYEYLTRQVVSGDRDRGRQQGLTDYYHEHGTPAGQWAGRGAELLGVEGQVSEEQMRALFGEGMRPDADAIIAREIDAGAGYKEALAKAALGSGLYGFRGGKTPINEIYGRLKAEFIEREKRSPDRDEWLELRTSAAREYLAGMLGHSPTGEQISEALAAEKRKARQAVVGWDCVFTPQKSVSILWGLGDAQMRQMIWECHEQAVGEVLERMQDKYALARRGRGGKKIIDADGLTVALFQHYDNRTGDPNPHTHAVISSMVRSDGKWSCLDARALHQAAVSLSCQYNATLVGKLTRRLGLQFEERSRGRGKEPVLEVAGVSDGMIGHFSRRADIMVRTEELVAQYRQVHGRNPSKAVQIKLAQQATLDTRADKPLPKSLAQMVAEWDGRARGFLGDGRGGRQFAADIQYQCQHPDAQRVFEAGRVAVQVGVELGGSAAVVAADPEQLGQAIDRALDRCVLDPDLGRVSAAMQVRRLLSARAEDNLLAQVDEAIAARQRAVFDPQRIAVEVTDKVSSRRATWVETHIRAAAEDRLAVCHFDSDAAQRAAVEQVVALVRDQHSIQLTIDPDPTPKQLARRNGESVFHGPAATTVRYTTEAVLAAEKRLQDAAWEPTPEFLTRAAVNEAIEQVQAETQAPTGGVPRRLMPGQRRIVEHICTSGTRLAVAVGPAGTGKTTALKAVVRAWENDGRRVIALSQQMSAARVLGAEIGVPGRTIDGFLTRARAGLDVGLRAGSMILVDEAGMAPTRNLHELQRLADAHGAVVRWVGDPYQLSAVESGGALRLIATDTRAPELTEVVRFADPAEASATLHIRHGEAEQAWDFYADHGRVTSGMADELREHILHAHLADTAAGHSSVMMAATLADVYALGGAAQAAHGMQGALDTSGPNTELSDGHTGYVGDVVVTRKNNSQLRIVGGSRAHQPVDNGDLWRITAIHDDGTLSVAGVKHRGRAVLPPDYVREHVELGYASTVHRAQGITTDRAHLLMNATLGRALAYVGLSRGKRSNHLYIATDALPDPELDHPPGEPANPREMFLRVLAREDDNLTATEVMRAEQQRISDPQRLRDIYDETTGLLTRTRGEYLLIRALPAALFAETARSRGYQRLLDTIGVAEALGMDSASLVAQIATRGHADLGESLATARDIAAVLTARADMLIETHLEQAAGASGAQNPAASPTSGPASHTTDTSPPPRFVALRDAPLPEIPPPPGRWPGIDLDLAELADSLYSRLTGTNPAELPVGGQQHAPAENLTPEAAHQAPSAHVPDERTKILRDYEYYVHELARDHARWLLKTALPQQVTDMVVASPGYGELLDTIALADAHLVNTRPLADALAADTNLHRYALTAARDPAAIVRTRVDEFLAQATGHASAIGQGPSRWRALNELPPPRGLAPVPPTHPDTDQTLADYARHLRERLRELGNQERETRNQMFADPIRLRPQQVLESWIATLRHTANTHAAALAPGPPENSTEKIRTQHHELAEQAALIRAAQAAETTAASASQSADAAHTATERARQTLADTSKLRRTARRHAEQHLTDRIGAEQRAHAEAARARDAAYTARAAAPPPSQWPSLLAKATDQDALHAELDATELTDARNQQIYARHAQRAAAAAGELDTALAEHARRAALSPLEAAREHRIRATQPATPTPRRQPTPQQRQAARRAMDQQLARNQDRGHGHGPGLG